MSEPHVAVIVVSWNVKDLLVDCLESVAAQRFAGRVSCWVVDNASNDDTPALLAERYPNVHLLQNDHNAGFGAANNQGMAAAAAVEPDYFFLLNPDTRLQPGALAALVAALEARPAAVMAGARLVYPDGRPQAAAFRFPGLWQLAYDLFPLPLRWYDSALNGRYPPARLRPGEPPLAVDCILGATMLLRAPEALASGGFDEGFFMYAEEIDWCGRLRAAGWEILFVPAAEVVHVAGASSDQRPAASILNLWESRARLYGRHHGPLTRGVAGRLARLGLRRKASRARDPERAAAFLQAAAAWESV